MAWGRRIRPANASTFHVRWLSCEVDIQGDLVYVEGAAAQVAEIQVDTADQVALVILQVGERAGGARQEQHTPVGPAVGRELLVRLELAPDRLEGRLDRVSQAAGCQCHQDLPVQPV